MAERPENEFVNIHLCDGCEKPSEEYMGCTRTTGRRHKFCIPCATSLVFRCLECNERLLPSEEIRDDIQCDKHIYGCTFSGNAKQAAEHQEQCRLGPIACPFDTQTHICIWDGTMEKLSEHFNLDHSDSFKIVDRYEGPYRDVLHNLRHNIERESAYSLWTDYSKAFYIEPDMFYARFAITTSDKFTCYLTNVGPNEEWWRKNRRYQIMLGKVGAENRRAIGELFGNISYISFKDVVSLCDEDGHLHFEVDFFEQKKGPNFNFYDSDD